MSTRSSKIPSPARLSRSSTKRAAAAPSPAAGLTPPARRASSPALSRASSQGSNGVQRSYLDDNTDIVSPKRKDWDDLLGDGSADCRVVLTSLDPRPSTPSDNSDLQQTRRSIAQKTANKFLLESTDSESIESIEVPRKKLFSQKDTSAKAPFIIPTAVPITKELKRKDVQYDKNETTKSTKTKELFTKAKRNKQTEWPVILDEENRASDSYPEENKKTILFNKPETKSKFVNVALSSSEDDSVNIPVLTENRMPFSKKTNTASRFPRKSALVPNSPTLTEFDDWKHLPSSTMIGTDIFNFTRNTATPPNLRSRSKSSELRKSQSKPSSAMSLPLIENVQEVRTPSRKSPPQIMTRSGAVHDDIQEIQTKRSSITASPLTENIEQVRAQSRNSARSMEKTLSIHMPRLTFDDESQNKSPTKIFSPLNENYEDERDSSRNSEISIEKSTSQVKNRSKVAQDAVQEIRPKRSSRISAPLNESDDADKGSSRNSSTPIEKSSSQLKIRSKVAQDAVQEIRPKRSSRISGPLNESDVADRGSSRNSSKSIEKSSSQVKSRSKVAQDAVQEIRPKRSSRISAPLNESDDADKGSSRNSSTPIEKSSSQVKSRSKVAQEAVQEIRPKRSSRISAPLNESDVADRGSSRNSSKSIEKSSSQVKSRSKVAQDAVQEIRPKRSSRISATLNESVDEDKGSSRNASKSIEKSSSQVKSRSKVAQDAVQEIRPKRSSRISSPLNENNERERGSSINLDSSIEKSSSQIDPLSKMTSDEEQGTGTSRSSSRATNKIIKNWQSVSQLPEEQSRDADNQPQLEVQASRNNSRASYKTTDNLQSMSRARKESSQGDVKRSQQPLKQSTSNEIERESIGHGEQLSKRSRSQDSDDESSPKRVHLSVEVHDEDDNIFDSKESATQSLLRQETTEESRRVSSKFSGQEQLSNNSMASEAGDESVSSDENIEPEDNDTDSDQIASGSATLVNTPVSLAGNKSAFDQIASGSGIPQIERICASQVPVNSLLHESRAVEMSFDSHKKNRLQKRSPIGIAKQTTLESYLERIKNDNVERKKNAAKTVFESFKQPTAEILPVKVVPLRVRAQSSRNRAAINNRTLEAKKIDGVVYKAPKVYAPKNWVTNRLYAFLEEKLAKKYNVEARVRAERVIKTLVDVTNQLGRKTSNKRLLVRTLERELARHEIVVTYWDYYHFLHEYIPNEISVMMMPHCANDLPTPKNGVFSKILH